VTWLCDYLAFRRVEVAERLRTRPLAELWAAVRDREPARDFVGSLTGQPSVIAEIKFRSPSMGLLRPAADVEAVAAGYGRAGASALSVLVDEVHFGGERSFLGRARAACPLPILAKGFFVDPSDLLEARLAGADAALLIARALTREELARMLGTARDAGLAALLELHDEADLAKIAGLDVDLVGVNHRDLDSLAMDLTLSDCLAPRLPACRGRVAESGLSTPADFRRMAALGYNAVLVGTAFMAQPDPGEALARLLEGVHACH
jgi:indole-3-glycerol phosphate synthase